MSVPSQLDGVTGRQPERRRAAVVRRNIRYRLRVRLVSWRWDRRSAVTAIAVWVMCFRSLSRHLWLI